MGSGGSTVLLPPGKLDHAHPVDREALEFRSKACRAAGNQIRQKLALVLYDQASRAISTG